MPLSEEQRVMLARAAEEAGVSPDDLIAEGEAVVGEQSDAGEAQAAAGGRPTFERLLIGVLPYIRVSELRRLWLKIDAPLPDDDLTCLEHELKTRQKYGGGPSTGGASASTEEE